jgi:putative FmdB family regulatory protein
MPTYQYRCKEEACRHEFEAVQSFSDPTLTECPVCGGEIAKVFSGVGISFKGGGFYTTDHGSRSKATSTSSGSSSSDSSSSTSSSSATSSTAD